MILCDIGNTTYHFLVKGKHKKYFLDEKVPKFDDEVYFVSFIHHLTIVRNFTAHHARVWNREFPLTWKLPLSKPASVIGSLNRQDGKRIYNTLAMLACLIDVINPGNHWKKRLSDLINSSPGIQTRYMGFPDNWRDLPLWKGKV